VFRRFHLVQKSALPFFLPDTPNPGLFFFFPAFPFRPGQCHLCFPNPKLIIPLHRLFFPPIAPRPILSRLILFSFLPNYCLSCYPPPAPAHTDSIYPPILRQTWNFSPVHSFPPASETGPPQLPIGQHGFPFLVFCA